MIIVKLTVASIMLSVMLFLAMWVYVNVFTSEYLKARKSGKYPIWCYLMLLSFAISVIGIFASVIWALFFR